MKFLNIVLANGGISESALETTRADPISVSFRDMYPHVQENFLRKLQDASAQGGAAQNDIGDATQNDTGAAAQNDASAQGGGEQKGASAQGGDAQKDASAQKKRVIYTCTDDSGCGDSQVGKNCVNGFCVDDACKDVEYNGVDPNPEACWLWKFPGDNVGFYKRTTVKREFSDSLAAQCLFYRFFECSKEDVQYRTNPRNCEYELQEFGQCDHWETPEGEEIGYARNAAVLKPKEGSPKNSNGQTCWKKGSVPSPKTAAGQTGIEKGDKFWKNKLDGHCMGANMVKPAADGGCGLTFGDWEDCKKWSGFGDIFPNDLTDGKWLFAQIRPHSIAVEDKKVLATGEVCEKYNPETRNIVREPNQGVQKCTNPAEICPKQSDKVNAYHKVGCCEYEFSADFGACKDGKKMKTITKILKAASGVPCYDDKAITEHKMNTEEGIRKTGFQLKDQWKGSLWEAC